MHRLSRRVRAAAIGLLASSLFVGAAHAGPSPASDPDPAAKSDPAPVVAPSDTGSYIVVMVDDPLIAEIAPDDLDTPAAEAEAQAMEAEQDQVLDETGVGADEKIQGFTNALNGFAATMSYDEAVKVASHPKVAAVLPDELRQLTTDSSGEFLGLTGRGGAYASGLTGEGVIVGVIDSGIWPEHPSFADDGSYSDLGIALDESEFSACDFGNTAHNPNDAPFTCNNKLLGARQMLATYRALIGADPDEFDSARDDDGHGTHTASTAAGNADVDASIFGKDYGEVSGIAPRARVIAYKGLGNLGGFTSDLAASIDQAVADGVDVINYSVGGGASVPTGGDDIAFLFAADAGVFVATSAGNSGPGSETVGSPGNAPWITTVGASTQDRFLAGTVRLTSSGKASDDSTYTAEHRRGRHWHWWHWHKRKRAERFMGASITPQLTTPTSIVDAADLGNDLCLVGEFADPSAVEGKVVLCRRGATARASKSLAVADAGGAGMILYNNTDSDNRFTDNHWIPSVHVDYSVGLEIKEYIAENANPKASIIRTGKSTEIDYAPSMAYFSSRGANGPVPDIIKPDITAPGHQILAGASPFPDPGSVGGELFQAISGTSMSSPHVAGVFALLKQAHPEWSAAMAKSALMTSADPDVRNDDRSSQATPFDMGAGHLDPGKVSRKGSAFNPGLVYDAGFADYYGFLCDVAPELVSAATCAALPSIGFATEAMNLNYPSIAVSALAGSETITRTVTSVADRPVHYHAHIDAPAGYTATVTPSEFTIAPGESVTYELTITNDGSGPVGEWRFGAIMWGSGDRDKYDVRSPIAVRGTTIGTPDAIAAAGTSGSASFEVQFGYTGSYAAAPHGPVANDPITGEISQDPDQTYPSPDDTPAGVNRIPVTLQGVAFARWELVIPGDDDIDLFLEDSSGTIIAASTSGGTDELIELVLPADGEYTMVVHGWSVPSEPLAYSMGQWLVPVQAGTGALSVDAAPASATTGQSGTVEVSWTGLDEGTEYLGAVSHAGDSGLLGLTLVEIDTTAP